ncbi:biopolymer transporter ExbD [Alcaligenes sp. 13f]|uniref:ExbD/TolR family protein n=1 Tax=Alcaligenes sp. 13f TaxID=2841924 RepID=UPI001CF6B071|nr:biopolymer transporter ExbD [Alcaligenes sp. 13f]MCB4321212.1 biopolymer transporter ExbD [Alcaligenes sp. 13f]
MAFGSFDNRNSGSALSEINMVPLIDVMLVLLVIFLITAPLLSHSIKIQLPQATSEPVQQDPKTIDLAIDAEGQIFVNEQPVALEDLTATLAPYSKDQPQPELRIRADTDTRYETLAQVMSRSKASGLTRLGFITRPGPTTKAVGDEGEAKEGAVADQKAVEPKPAL